MAKKSEANYEVFWGETKEKRAFEDRHENTKAYIDYMRPRCVQLARVLKKTGSFYYHCDWHASRHPNWCSIPIGAANTPVLTFVTPWPCTKSCPP